MAENKEWYTQKEIADRLGVPVRKLYGKVNTLRNAGAIEWIADPNDQRAILINESGIDTIAAALQERGATTASRRPSIPYDIKRGDERLLPVDEAIEKYDLDQDWVNKNLTRLRFIGGKTTYVYIPEMEFEIDQVEIIPPGKE